MQYPDGAIKSLKELHSHDVVFGASKHFHSVDAECHSLGLTVAHIYDYNVHELNNYNDWFLFADEAKAKAWAGI